MLICDNKIYSIFIIHYFWNFKRLCTIESISIQCNFSLLKSKLLDDASLELKIKGI